MSYQDNALPNTLTIGDPAAPTLVLHNRSADGNGDGIVQIGGVFGVDVVGDTLSIDEVDATIQYGREPDVGMNVWEVYVGPDNQIYVGPDDAIYSRLLASAPDGTRGALVDVRTLPYGTPVKWECDARTIAAFYLRNVERVGKYLFRLAMISGVGLLDREDHAGGVYTGQTFAAVAADIIGGRFPCTIAPALADQQVYGWLPYDTRRNNLHQLLFALGASLRRDPGGAAQIVFLSAASPAAVPDSRVSFGGSVDYETPATRAEITEHAYLITQGDEDVTLFDNTEGGAPAASTLVIFDEGVPVHDLAVTGSLTIDSRGVNYAVVSGVGTLTGKRYTHTTRIVAQDSGSTGQPNVRHVEEMTLVSLANSLNVARRVLSYCSGARTVGASLILNGERCGDVLSLNDPYDDPITAFLQSISVNASTDLWGPAKLIEGYSPQYQGNNVTGSVQLSGSGTWTSPITGTVQYVLISGAQGGSAGSKGGDAPTPPIRNYSASGNYGGGSKGLVVARADAKAGAGGEPGLGGVGGRVLTGSLSVTTGQQITYNSGAGGAGEVFGSGVGHGADGTDTTFGALTTQGQQPLPDGFFDPITGNRYGAPGNAGINGGDGVGYDGDTLVEPQPITAGGATYYAGSPGRLKGESGGRAGFRMVGGFGGGPAYGSNGSNGGDGNGSLSPDGAIGYDGPGGNGATALPWPQETGPGQGGRGGNGGGGGGAFGAGHQDPPGDFAYNEEACWVETAWAAGGSALAIKLLVNNPAIGGDGSDGGQGADGCILLYWGD